MTSDPAFSQLSRPSLPAVSRQQAMSTAIGRTDWEWAMDNLPLGWSVVRSLRLQDRCDEDDLRQFLLVGLARASSLWNPNHLSGATRSTLAVTMLRRDLMDARRHDGLTPDRADGTVRRGRLTALIPRFVDEFDVPDHNSVVGDRAEFAGDRAEFAGDLIADVRAAMAFVAPDRDREVLRRYFGFDGPPENIIVLAGSLGVTKQMVSLILKRAMKSVRTAYGYGGARTARLGGQKRKRCLDCDRTAIAKGRCIGCYGRVRHENRKGK